MIINSVWTQSIAFRSPIAFRFAPNLAAQLQLASKMQLATTTTTTETLKLSAKSRNRERAPSDLVDVEPQTSRKSRAHSGSMLGSRAKVVT